MNKKQLKYTVLGRWLAFILCLALCLESSSRQVLAAETILNVEENDASGTRTEQDGSEQNEAEQDGSEQNGTGQDEVGRGETDRSEAEQNESDQGETSLDEAETPDESLDSVSENTLESISENDIDTDEEREVLISSAEEAFGLLLQEKTMMALLYHADTYEVREKADGESGAVATLEIGTTFYLLGVKITDEDIWYQVRFWLDGNEQSGYVQSYYLAYSDEDWLAWEEEYLQPLRRMETVLLRAYASTEGAAMSTADTSDIDAFPAIYQTALRSLKADHPNWTFVPMNTGLDFNTAVANETGSKSLIQKTSGNSSKGWVGSACPSESGWYYATTDAIAYYMNPCNFLTETYIFQFEQLTFNSSYHSVEAVQTFLNGTFMKGTLPDDSSKRTYAQAFYEIGKSRSLSPIHLASRVYQEQGSGTSGLISGTYSGYEGYYNFFNVNASGSSTAEKIQKGLAYAKSKGWNTRYKSLEGGAATIGNNYILKGQDTVYLEKFNVNKNSSYGVYNHQYMQNIQAPASESSSTKEMYSNAGSLNSAFVFKIPVFNNMPGMNPLESIGLQYNGTDVDADSPIVLRRSDTVATDISGFASEEKEANTAQASLQVVFTPEDTTDDRTITWSTSNANIATVTADSADSTKAVVTAKGTGEVTITAKASNAGNQTATCKVQVTAPIYSLTIKNLDLSETDVQDDSTTLFTGQSLNLMAEYEPKDTTSDTQITWSSSDEKVATVRNGKVTAVSSGTAVITASTVAVTGGTKKYTATYKITVKSCTVTFMNRAGSKLQTVSDIGYGETLSAETLTEVSGTASSQSEDLFIGWYTGQNGSGSRFDETTCVYQAEVILYPYYEEQGKGFYVLPIGDQTYTGSVIQPVIQVYDSVQCEDGNITLIPLVLNRDYTVSYKNNRNVNTSGSKNVPTVTVKGKGNYSGTQYATFNIVAKSLTDSDITAVDITVAYSGRTIKSTPQVMYGNKRLTAKTDYTVSYPQTGTGAYQKAGTYPIVVTGKGGYTGTITVYETITGSVLMSSVTVAKIPNQTYKSGLVNKEAGTGIEPAVTVKYKNTVLTESTDGGKTGDYTVSYQNNTAIGTATATITAVEGSDYTGRKSVTYKIVGSSLARVKVTGLENKVYTGNEDDVKQSGYVLTLGQTELRESTDGGKTGDYTVSYSGISKTGTAKIIFQGVNEYTGKVTKTYKIKDYNLTPDEDGNNVCISMKYYLQGEDKDKAEPITSLSEITAPYVKGGTKPVVILYLNGVELVPGTDYTIRYANNNAVTTEDMDAGRRPKITITGKGNLKGSLSGSWQITDGQMSDENGKLTMTVPDVVYKNKKGAYKTTVTIKDISGRKLIAGKDYAKNPSYTYEEAVTWKGANGETIRRLQGDSVKDGDIVPAGTKLRVTVTGMGAYAGAGEVGASLSQTYRVVMKDISGATVKVDAQSYLNGREVTLKPTDLSVTFRGVAAPLEEGVDYVIDETTYTNNTGRGRASVVIRGIGIYGGEKKVTYTIGTRKIFWWKG